MTTIAGPAADLQSGRPRPGNPHPHPDPAGQPGPGVATLRIEPAYRPQIVDALEPLRANDGSLPTATIEVPLTFDTAPSIAGTAWVALVRFELERPAGRPTLWP